LAKKMTRSHTSRRRCTAKTQTGSPCRMAPLVGTPRCWNHSQATRTKAQAARRKGGRRGRVGQADLPVNVKTVSALQGHLGQTLADVLRCEASLKKGMTVARLISVGLRLVEIEDLRQRVEQLEATIEARQ
jgi:hypothetical protein